MRKILILSIFVISCLASNNELSWVDEQVNAIKPNRNGTTNTKISKIRNPFIYLKKNMSKKSNSAKESTTKSRLTSNAITKSDSNSNETLSSLKKVTTPNSILTLSAIINSSALINGQWYKLGQKVNNYKIVKMHKSSVTLTRGKKTTVLTTKSSASKLKFK